MHENDTTLQPGDVVALTEDLAYAGGIPAGTEGVITRVFNAIGTLYEIDCEGYTPVILRPSLVAFVERPPDIRDDWDLMVHAARLMALRTGGAVRTIGIRVNKKNAPTSA